MRKTIIIFLFIISCKPSPTYNPFDIIFDISIREVLKNGCDTVFVCQSINLLEKKGRFKSYYQVYAGEIEVVAKGFTYFLDTIDLRKLNSYKEVYSVEITKEVIDKFNVALKKYNYKFLSFNKDRLKIIRTDLKDTLKVAVLIEPIYEMDSMVVRTLEYWKPKPNLR